MTLLIYQSKIAYVKEHSWDFGSEFRVEDQRKYQNPYTLDTNVATLLKINHSTNPN